LLANLYMNRFLKYWRITGRSELFQAEVINYADDFVILSRDCAAEALNWTRSVMTRIGLTLNEAKTSIKQARRERFDFLGYVGVHGEAAAQFDPTGAVVRICQKALDQRSGPTGVTRAIATRARAWLSRRRLSHVLFSWSIVSIGYWLRSWPKPIRCWCRINAGRSQPQGPQTSRKLRG
jgi:hypothetical protein